MASSTESAAPVSEAISRYLEAIYYIDAEGLLVRPSDVADWLGVTHPSTSAAVRRMVDAGLISHGKASGVQLTKRGHELASQIVRRHRIAERWMVDVLGFDWLTADEEASRIEHGMSDAVADRLFESIGRPATCPHGNPIPGVDAERPPERQLATLAEGERAPLQRISEVAEHQTPDLLRFLGEHGFALDREIEVTNLSREAGVMTVSVAGNSVSMSLDVATKVWVGA